MARDEVEFDTPALKDLGPNPNEYSTLKMINNDMIECRQQYLLFLYGYRKKSLNWIISTIVSRYRCFSFALERELFQPPDLQIVKL